MTGNVRHVWVRGAGGHQWPGLVIAWRRTNVGSWEAYVAMITDGLLLCWEPANKLRPVTNHQPERQPPGKLSK